MAEARVLIPRYSPAWTDHNAHDPGVTLAELYAWLAEMLLYRLDRVSPAQLRVFLRWAGVEEQPARCAQTMVCLRSTGAGPATLTAGAQLSDQAATVAFESGDSGDLSRAWIELSTNEATDRGRVVTVAGGVTTDQTALNRRPGSGYSAFGPMPRPGDSLLFGFDVAPIAAGHQARIGIWTTSWESDDARRASLISEWEHARTRCLTPANPCCQDPVATPMPPLKPRWWSHPDVVTQWQYWNGSVWSELAAEDETRALTLSGPVTLTGPSDHAPGPDDPRYWIRNVVLSGLYDCPPGLAAIGINAVRAEHSATVLGPKSVGTSDGSAGQIFELVRRLSWWSEAQIQGVVDGSVQLRITDGSDIDDGWRQRRNWDESLPDDRDFVVEALSGTVTFGNGRKGRVPPPNSKIEALTHRLGGGVAGNVSAGTLTNLKTAGPPAVVVQPFAAIGGAEGELLEDARGRALDLLASPSRTVTASDFAKLALATPGVRVARAHAIPGHHADFPCVPAAGVVTVVVMPTCGSPPIPQRGFMDEVARHLEPLRPLTTEIRVVAPDYREIVVAATLHIEERVEASGVFVAARKTLDAYFDPLHGGPEGTGWPFGRSIFESELLALLAAMPGVRFVDGLTITADCSGCGELGLCPTALVKSGDHNLTIEGGYA